MADTAGTEFWRDIKPITSVFKPEALPEVYTSDAPTDDLTYYVPLTETVLLGCLATRFPTLHPGRPVPTPDPKVTFGANPVKCGAAKAADGRHP